MCKKMPIIRHGFVLFINPKGLTGSGDRGLGLHVSRRCCNSSVGVCNISSKVFRITFHQASFRLVSYIMPS